MDAPDIPAEMSADASAANAIATGEVTKTKTMPIACQAADCATPPAPEQPRTRRSADPRVKTAGRSRPQRWRDAVVELLALQAEYANWLAALPDSLSDSQTAEALEAIVDLDLTELADIEPPRGYGRD